MKRYDTAYRILVECDETLKQLIETDTQKLDDILSRAKRRTDAGKLTSPLTRSITAAVDSRIRIAELLLGSKEPTVYFVLNADAGQVKIGYTEQPVEKRIRALQTGAGSELALLHTMPGTREDEKALHAQLAEHRATGEWFDYNDTVKGVIDTLREDSECT